MKLVVSSKGKIVTAKEVLAAGPHPRPLMETIIITLMHLALHSEKLELEVFIFPQENFEKYIFFSLILDR